VEVREGVRQVVVGALEVVGVQFDGEGAEAGVDERCRRRCLAGGRQGRSLPALFWLLACSFFPAPWSLYPVL